MKHLVLATLLLAPSLAFAQIPVGILLPIVGIQSDGIVTLKDKRGQRYFVQTDCDVKTDDIEEFTVAMCLINMAKGGETIPESLPLEMIPPSKR